MATAKISVYCPPMKINKVSRRLRRTDAEPMEAIVLLLDGAVVLKPVLIPETFVDKLGLLHWMVRACKGVYEGADASLIVNLPKEPVWFEWSEMTLVAQPIEAETTLVLPDLETWTGKVRFPKCRLNIWTMTAKEVTAEGKLTLKE